MKLNNPSLWTAITFFVASGMQLGGYQSKEVAYMLFAVSGVLFLYSAALTLLLPGGAGAKWHALRALMFGGKLPLHVASQVAYEAARKHGTLLGSRRGETLALITRRVASLITLRRTSACTFRSSASVHRAPTMKSST